MFARRVLILVPHPDDEVVGAAAAIGRAAAQGSTVLGLYLTSGVPAADRMWPWRRKSRASFVALRYAEMRTAASFLGLDVAAIQDIPARTLKNTLRESHRRISETLRKTGADAIWAPAYEGGHQDHDAANFLAHLFAPEVRVFEFAEYNFSRGRVHSQEFAAPAGNEILLTLDAAERARKKAALALYASERGNLGYVAVERECFRPLASYDYAKPPHEGRLFYQRFQWVPRHPRVDHTRPAEVCRALAGYRAQR